jgi:hydroxyethylthiazole kinase-like uncharacterized protein yjeF
VTSSARHPAPLRIGTAPAPTPDGWPLHDAATSRQIEAAAASPLSPHTLMQRAGLGVARLAQAVAPHARRIVVLAGPGNNGGDGFEAALQLHQHLHRRQHPSSRDVVLHLLDSGHSCPPDAAASRQRAQDAGVPIVQGLGDTDLDHADLVLDALLGRGLSRPADGAMAQAIRQLAHTDSTIPVLAVDLPSGLPGDTGALAPQTACVRARWTLALLGLAPGLFTADGRDHAGEVWWDGLGLDWHDTPFASHAPAAWLHTGRHPAMAWPDRRHAQHKGSFGDVRVVGGDRSMAGAVLLAARAALGVGAGRVYAHPLDPDAPHLDPVHPELMLAGPPTPDLLAQATVVAGCGGGRAIRTCLPDLLTHAARLLLDADALNAVAADTTLRQRLRERHGHGLATVLTPHPLEAARLLGCNTAEVQSDRLHAARTLAPDTGAVVVLKGSGSVVAAPGQAPWINASGNAALATPGSGDVLAGWIGGLWSQLSGGTARPDAAPLWHDAARAARHAVHQHGLRAEQYRPAGEVLIASRLVPSSGS